MRGKAAARSRDRARSLAAVAKRFDSFRPAAEVLKRVTAVPTRFVQLDHATRVGGLPVERFMLLHGPSNEGKTLMTIGLEDSFLSAGHFVLHVDAERTTSITWADQLMGGNAKHPFYFALRPTTYEDTIAQVREFLNRVAAARDAGEVDPATSALVVVDSLKKLVPANLMKEILREEQRAGDVKGGNDRGGQLKAKMNAAWMDELIPLLEHARAGFVAIAREMQDPDADQWQRKFGNDYKVGGGGAIYYDASLVMRVERAGWVAHGEGKDRKTYGERHRITIKKTKVGGKEDRTTVAHFHSSNGTFTPFGFDRARDVLELGLRFGVLERRGSWIAEADNDKLGNSEHSAALTLSHDPELLARVELAVRRVFDDNAPAEEQAHDPETGEVAG